MTYIQFKPLPYTQFVQGDYEYHQFPNREQAALEYTKYMKGGWFMVSDTTYARKNIVLPRAHSYSGFAQ